MTTLTLLALVAVAAPSPAASARVLDEGTFVLTLAGQRAGREAFWVLARPGGAIEIRARAEFHAGASGSAIEGFVRTDARLRPAEARFLWQSGGERRRLRLARRGAGLELATEGPGPSIVQTRDGSTPDLFFLQAPTVLAHLVPLCRLAGPRPRTLAAFPSLPLVLSAAEPRRFAQTRLGAPLIALRVVVADVASSRFELACEGSRLLAVRHGARGLVAVRSGYEALAVALAARPASKPPLPPALAERALRLAVPAGPGTGPARLACASLLPQASPAGASAPAVLLVGDDAAADRDGDPVAPGEPQLSLLRTIAVRLAEAGIASLRCDGRGVVAGGIAPRARPTLEARASDARALLAALRRQAGIDPARTGVVGHGEGALVAALTADREPGLRALALLAPPGRPVAARLLDDEEAELRRWAFPEAEVQLTLAARRALLAAATRNRPLSPAIPAAERHAALGALAWLASRAAHDPPALVARATRLPLFIAHGARAEGLPALDADLLRRTLADAGAADATLRVYPDLDHAFAPAPAPAPTTLASPRDPSATVADAFLSDLARFVRRRLDEPPREPSGAARRSASREAGATLTFAPLHPCKNLGCD